MNYLELLDKVLVEGHSIFEADTINTINLKPPEEKSEEKQELDPEKVKNFNIQNLRYRGLHQEDWLIKKPEWLAVDPDLVEKLANLQNFEMFKNAVLKLARDLGTGDTKKARVYDDKLKKYIDVKASKGEMDYDFLSLFAQALDAKDPTITDEEVQKLPRKAKEGQTAELDGSSFYYSGNTWIKLGDKGASYDNLVHEIRYEAREVFEDVKAALPKGHPVARKQLKPDKLFLSDDDKKLSIAQQKEKAVEAQKKMLQKNPKYNTFYGGTAYGIFDKNTGEMVAPEKGSKIRFKSEFDAEAFLLDHQDDYGYDVFEDPDDYEIKPYDNDKSLKTLMKTIAPLQNGWSVEEVIQACVPYIYSVANTYRPTNGERPFGPKDIAHFGELEQAAVVGDGSSGVIGPDGKIHIKKDKDGNPIAQQGILGALANDRGDAPFGKYVWRYMASAVQRVANKTGMGSGSAGQFGRAGVIRGYIVTWPDPGNGEIQKEYFPAEPSGFEDFRERNKGSDKKYNNTTPRSRTYDAGYKKALEFKKEKKEIFKQRLKNLQINKASQDEIDRAQSDLMRVVLIDDRPSLIAGDAAVGGDVGGDGSGDAGGRVMDFKRAKEPDPAQITSQKDYTDYLLNNAGLTDEELEAVKRMTGMIDPEMGKQGIPHPSPFFRKPESYSDIRKPGQQAGRDRETAIHRDSQGRIIKGDSVENEPEFAMGWKDAANWHLPHSAGRPLRGDKAKAAYQRAILKLRDVADALEDKDLEFDPKSDPYFDKENNLITKRGQGEKMKRRLKRGIPESITRPVMEFLEREYIRLLLA